MKILLTGASSFTGAWFAHDLSAAGHHVVAAVRGRQEDYTGLKAERLAWCGPQCEMQWDVSFGSPAFLALVERCGPFDVLCHHAAEVKDYKRADFDATAALASNVAGLRAVLSALKGGGCRRVVLTGSVFEADEGAGSAPLAAFSPYGLSKTLTAEAFRFYTQQAGMALGKFVIANPFGPYEEPRFANYLMRCWLEGKVARVNTPLYVRDNIHVDLLSKAYCDFVIGLPDSGYCRLNPSEYVEQQGAFAQRFAREMEARLQIDAALELADQTDFSEPMIRINTDFIVPAVLGWSEAGAWDRLAAYYAQHMSLIEREGRPGR